MSWVIRYIVPKAPGGFSRGDLRVLYHKGAANTVIQRGWAEMVGEGTIADYKSQRKKRKSKKANVKPINPVVDSGSEGGSEDTSSVDTGGEAETPPSGE